MPMFSVGIKDNKWETGKALAKKQAEYDILLDIIFGSLATLIGALGARLFTKLSKKLLPLAGIPTIIANTIIVPPVLIFAYGAVEGYFFILFTVFLGELISAGFLGAILYSVIVKYKLDRLF